MLNRVKIRVCYIKETVTMTKANIIDVDVKRRVQKAVKDGMDLYLTKIKYGFIEVGLEATFQLQLARIIDDILQLLTFDINERFQIILERNMPILGNKDYVDIVIKYHNNSVEKLYLIEVKFKKIADAAPDANTIYSYQDMMNLDAHKNLTPNVDGCFFIFLTDLQTYKNKPRATGTRAELPMQDGAIIQSGINYNVTGASAIKCMNGYANGFTFTASHTIEYKEFDINDHLYWFFIEEF